MNSSIIKKTEGVLHVWCAEQSLTREFDQYPDWLRERFERHWMEQGACYHINDPDGGFAMVKGEDIRCVVPYNHFIFENTDNELIVKDIHEFQQITSTSGYLQEVFNGLTFGDNSECGPIIEYKYNIYTLYKNGCYMGSAVADEGYQVIQVGPCEVEAHDLEEWAQRYDGYTCTRTPMTHIIQTK